MNYHDSWWCNSESVFFQKISILKVFKLFNILKIIQFMKVLIRIWLQYWYTHLDYLQ